MSVMEKLILKMQRKPNDIKFREIVKILEYNGYKMKLKKRYIT